VFAVDFWLNYQKKGDGLYSRRKHDQFQLMSLEAFISHDNTVGFVDAIRTIKNAIFSKSSCSLPIFDFKIKENRN